MRFYGLNQENKIKEAIENISEGNWVFEDKALNRVEKGNKDFAKEKLLYVLKEIESWKNTLTLIPKDTIFIFVSEPQNPIAFKIYDTSSLGCSTSLTPPRWVIRKEEIEIK